MNNIWEGVECVVLRVTFNFYEHKRIEIVYGICHWLPPKKNSGFATTEAGTRLYVRETLSGDFLPFNREFGGNIIDRRNRTAVDGERRGRKEEEAAEKRRQGRGEDGRDTKHRWRSVFVQSILHVYDFQYD